MKKNFLKTALLLSLAACAGFSPGSSGDSVGGGPGQNSLGPPGSSTGGDGGGTPGTQAGSGIPGTQQTEPGIGIPGGIGFDIQVHILENGRERLCDGSLGPLGSTAIPPTANSMAKGLIRQDWEMGGTEILDDPVGPEPRVTFTFVPEIGVRPGPQTKKAVCTEDKRWLAHFWYGFACTGDRCSVFQVTSQAMVRVNGVDYESRTFQGPPFPNRTENEVPIPIHLAIPR